MFEALDDISEPAYVVDPETYDILYVNEAGKKSFHLEDLCGLKCYQVFQGLNAPCDFCAEKRLKEDEIYTWEHCNPVTGRYYLLKNGHIDWEGKAARVEAAFDCTEQAGEKRELMIRLADKEMCENKRPFYRSKEADRRAARSTGDDALLEEYNTLTRSLRVSVSRHLLRDDFLLIWANECFFDLIGYTSEEFEAYCHGDIKKYLENDAAEYERLRQTVMEEYQAGKQSYETTIRVPRKDGMHIWIRLVGTYTDEIVEGVPVVFTTFTDVTDIVQMRIEQSTTYDNLPGFVVKICISEDRPHLLYGNKRFMDFHGEQTPGNPNELLTDNVRLNQEVIAQHYEAMRAGQPVNFEVRAKNIHGQEFYFQIYGGCVEKIQDDPVYLFVFIDITEMVNQRARLNEFAFVDAVTGGMNRTCFEIEAGGAVAAAPAGTYVLVSLDIQKFKVINDLFGIGNGDRTLRHVYEKIKAGLGQDEYVARLAADDFSVLLKADTNSRIEARISALIEDINSYNKELTNKYFLTFAVGVYPVDDPTLLMTQLQDRANVARNQIGDIADGKLFACRFYSNQDRLGMAREKEIENRMRDALENKEFEVYLQPKQDVKNGTVGGAEALVRWNVPGEGLLPPGEFIPLFERNGFIVDLDLFVFDQTCAVLRKWLDQGLSPVPISVNMSRAHLVNPRFLDEYEEIRKRYEVPSEFLEIELTETLVFENPRLLSQIIDDIHRCDYNCSMDDFGSGYSSLNVLKNIRVDVLKLDRAFFLSDKVDDPWEAAVIGVVVELAKKLGMKTVAEGVETSEQAAFLEEVGCDMIQGYLFSRPVPVAQFEQILFGKSIDER